MYLSVHTLACLLCFFQKNNKMLFRSALIPLIPLYAVASIAANQLRGYDSDHELTLDKIAGEEDSRRLDEDFCNESGINEVRPR